MFKQALRVVAAAVVGAVLSLTVSAQRYPIRLDLNERAGLTYHLVASTTTNTTAEATSAGQLLQKGEDKVTVEIVANVTVVEAADSWATRRRFTILDSKVIRAERTNPILPPGTEVVALIENEQTVYQVNNKPVDEETAGALREVITLHISKVGDDDMYGSPTPKKIGESWQVNVDAVKTLMKEIGAQGGRQEIIGTGTLEKVENNHALVRSSVNVKDVMLPIKKELTTESGEIQTELWGRFPTLQDDLSKESNGKIVVSRFASGVTADGKKAMLHVVYERISRYEISRVKK